jgi:hypothetical protein
LRHVEPVRGAGEVQLLRDRDEVAKMTVLDHRVTRKTIVDTQR